VSSTEIAVELDESRYDRQERITWWDQDRLAASRVLVVGAGALGNEVVKNLVLAGVGSIVVLDFDTIELSNLSRCVFFRPEDEGQAKATTLAGRAQELNPAVEVLGVAGDARALGAGAALRADVLVGALDSREARLFLNRLAWRVGRPWVDGAMEALTGVARVFSPPESCYECTLTARDFEILAHRQSCRLLSNEDIVEGKVPTTATTSSIVAGVQAQEVIKLLHRDREQGGAPVMAGAIFFDGANNDAYPLTYPFDEDCLAHHTYEDPATLEADSATTFADVATAAGFDEAIIELGDDHLLGWRCTTCDVEEEARGLITFLTVADSACPTCDEARQPITASSLPVPGPHAGEALHTFGVRPDEVLPVRQGLEYRYVRARAAVPELPEEWL
jgi:adenylyltransferase/sulfurtransferase